MTPPSHTPLDASNARTGGPERAWRVGLVAFQLGAVLLVVYVYQLETRSFFRVLLLASIGFVASTLLPARHRLAFFAGLSIFALVVAVGVNAATVILAVGTLLIVICHLPLRLAWRVVLIVATAVAVAMMRSDLREFGVMPILASMFMFRLVLYLYELRHVHDRLSPARALSYFFMLPNVCFPLFPVVDNELFRRRYFDVDDVAIYEKGVRWILKGLVQLFVRRLVAYAFVVDDLSVNDLADLLRFLVAGFATYLDVSGTFHIIVGILHLFGFRLPATHYRYLLARNVSDLWRRMNIYWKDFMIRLVYNPSFFALRRRQPRWALPLSAVAVFLASWALHSYQQFWLTGQPRLSWQDASFWGVFAALVVLTTARPQSLRASIRTQPKWSLTRAIGTVGTISVLLLLWSYWSAQSVDTWIYMWTKVRFASREVFLVLAVVVAGFTIIAGIDWDVAHRRDEVAREPFTLAIRRSLLWITGAALLVALTHSAVHSVLPMWLLKVTYAMGRPPVTEKTLRARVVGYYEALAAQPGRTANHWNPVPDPTIVKWDFREVARSDFLFHGLRPGFHKWIEGKEVTVNTLGFRDEVRDPIKPDDVIRIAMIGPSYVVGWGVADDETFSRLLQSSMDSSSRPSGQRVEVLNFSATEWTEEQSAYAIGALAARFSPDLTILAVSPGGRVNLVTLIDRLQDAQIEIPDSALAGLLERTGITPEMDRSEIAVRLRLVDESWARLLASWVIRQASQTRTRVAVVELRMPADPSRSDLKPLRRSFEAAGIPWLNCSNAYDGDEEELKVDANDRHPNAAGHRMIARCLESQIVSNRHLLPRWRASISSTLMRASANNP